MIHSEVKYPHDYERLPRIKQLLQELDWEIVCVFDACRWDAYEEVCGDAEPVTSPDRNTPLWTDQIWCDPDCDWSDVTYISGNGQTRAVRNYDRRENDGIIENHVKEHVEAYNMDDVWDKYVNSARPDRLTELVEDYEPPIVVHYVQPHTPFIGNLSLTVNGDMDELPDDRLSEDDRVGSAEYYMVEKGLIDQSYLRMAYLENLRAAWKEARQLGRSYDRVIYTADHGEVLGPDKYHHGGTNKHQTRVIPFDTNQSWDVDLPDPETVGAASDHDWLYHGESTSDDDRTDAEGPDFDIDEEQDLEEKLESLGYL